MTQGSHAKGDAHDAAVSTAPVPAADLDAELDAEIAAQERAIATADKADLKAMNAHLAELRAKKGN